MSSKEMSMQSGQAAAVASGEGAVWKRADFEIPDGATGAVIATIRRLSPPGPVFVYERRDPRTGLALTSWIGIRARSMAIGVDEDRDPFVELRRVLSSADALGDVLAFIGYPRPEHLLDAAPSPDAPPRALFLIPDEYVRLDHRAHTGSYLRRCEVGQMEPGMTVEEAARACAAGREPDREVVPDEGELSWSCDTTESAFAAHVHRAQELIAPDPAAGVVLSVRMSSRTPADALCSYRALRQINPSPCMFMLRDGDFGLWGATSLSLVEIVDRRLVAETDGATRPVPPLADGEVFQWTPSAKEIHEYQVVADALREDLLAVAAPRSLTFTSEVEHREFFGLRHLFAQARAELAADRDAVDVVKALYPHGAAVGYPRSLARRLIDELEPQPRGPFAGIVGMFNGAGGVDAAAVIRSMWSTPHGSFAQAGAKVVDESSAAAEYRECILKTAALRKSARQVVPCR
jgi:anthranilate/para-aminobenzoate synthase component I